LMDGPAAEIAEVFAGDGDHGGVVGMGGRAGNGKELAPCAGGGVW
jgi:hypothetical protein